MNIHRAFAPIKRIELGLSDLYKWYSELLSSDTEAAFVFKRLSLDEKSHAALVDYGRKIFLQNPKEFGEIELDLEELSVIADKIDSIRAGDCPNVTSAISVALEFEFNAVRYHCKAALFKANPTIAKLFEHLGRSDQQHIGEIQELARTRGVPLPKQKDSDSLQ